MLATLKNQESLFNLKNVFSFMSIIPVECEYENYSYSATISCGLLSFLNHKTYRVIYIAFTWSQIVT